LGETQFQAKSFECSGCANRCEVVEIMQEEISLAKWGDRCGKWSTATGVGIDRGITKGEEKRRA